LYYVVVWLVVYPEASWALAEAVDLVGDVLACEFVADFG
jgi:hypothetical protein